MTIQQGDSTSTALSPPTQSITSQTQYNSTTTGTTTQATTLIGMPANKTQTSITGRLAVVYPTGHAARYYLIDSLGPIELIPVKEIGPLYRYDRVTITATGNLVSQENQRVLYMEEWAPLPSQQARFPTVSGPQSTLMILLQFSDMAGSHPVSYFQNMLTGSRGSMNAYYVEVSYNSITVTGTTTSQWYTLPHPSSYYNVNTWSSCAYGGDFDKLTQDIISLVDPYVNFGLRTFPLRNS